MSRPGSEQIISIENRVNPLTSESTNGIGSPTDKFSSRSRPQTTQRTPPRPSDHQIMNIETNGHMKIRATPDTNRKVWTTAKEAFKSGKTLSYSFRLEQLKQAKRMLIEYKEELLQALKDDLRKPRFEAEIADYHNTCKELDNQIDNLRSNMRDISKPYSMWQWHFDRAYVKLDPYGVVLILGTWNYPVNLTLCPVWGAIAAGNCVIIKPSEISKHTSALIAQMIPKYLDNSCYNVIQGDVSVTLDLLKLRFDYILATGSTVVGKSVLRAAAEHLTPVTLELGGKCPAYIDDSTNVESAIKRTLWAKCINLGQSCVGVDYVLCSEEIEKKIVDMAPDLFQQWFGEDIQRSDDLTRIINENHFNRLKKILDETKGTVAYGGRHDIKDLFISPTILVNVDSSDVSMKDEIFGPILPIIRVKDSDEAIEFINSRPKPLALYLFCSKRSVVKDFKQRTSSGQLCINDVLLQFGWRHIPFGGVGDSGMGAYHEKYSFKTFSHEKAILHRSIYWINEMIEKHRYPPHDGRKIKYFLYLIRVLDSKFSFIEFNGVIGLLVGIFIGLLVKFVLSLAFPCIF